MNFLYPYYRRWNIDRIELLFFVLLLLASVTMLQVIYPYACLIVFLCLAFSFIVILKPLFGIYLLILLYPLDVFNLIIRSPQPQTIHLFFQDIFSCVLLLVIIVRQLGERHQCRLHAEPFKAFPYKWIFFLLALFVIWSIFSLFGSEHFIVSLFGWWRFISSFIVIAYISIYLDSYDKFIGVLIFYCCVSVIFASTAVYATTNVFKVVYELFQIFDTFISIQFGLFNAAGNIMLTHKGMLPGMGLASKHELSMLLMGGIFFAIYLMKIYESIKIRCVLLTLILLFMTIIHQVSARLSVVGMFIVVVFFFLSIPSARKSTIRVMVILIVMNLAGHYCSSLIEPIHKKNMEASQQFIEMANAESDFATSSMAFRKYLWKRAAERISRNMGLGSGPDSLMSDISFTSVHAHNIFITLAADYGITGVLLILLFLFVIANSAYRSVFIEPQVKNNLWFLQAILVASSLHALFENCFDVSIGQKQLWFMFGLLMASIHVAEIEKARDKLHLP